MRQWMCDPMFMCRKHLFGEHVEHHMFLGTLLKKKAIDGYIKNDLFEPLSLKERHDVIVNEIIKRQYNHYTPLNYDTSIFQYLSTTQINHKIDRDNSLFLLLSRCNDCQKRYDYLYYQALEKGEIK